jgi:hypothetical protein
VAVAPLHQRDQHRPEVYALVGEPVLEALGALLVGALLEDPLVDEAPQAVGQDVARDAEVILEVVEAPHAEEGVADDQHRPAVPDPLQRAGDRADLLVVGAREHRLPA